jgi:hypothetical protein
VSQPRQKPPGSKATQWPPTPRRDSSKTKRPPTELPTRSTAPSFSRSMNSTGASAKAEMVCRPGTGGELPCPGISIRINSRERLSAGAIVSHDRRLPPSPWTMSRGRPEPTRSNCKLIRGQRSMRTAVQHCSRTGERFRVAVRLTGLVAAVLGAILNGGVGSRRSATRAKAR